MTFVLCLLLLPSIFASAKSQMMVPEQYADFINKLDAAVTSWQDRIRRLDATNLSLSSDKVQQLSAKRALAIAVLDQTKTKVVAERDHASLALEITLSDTLKTASDLLMLLITDVPDSPEKKAWADTVTTIQHDIGKYADPLGRHIVSKADDLEYRLEDCEAQSKKRPQ